MAGGSTLRSCQSPQPVRRVSKLFASAELTCCTRDMSESSGTPGQSLSLRDALITWSSPAAIRAVEEAERRYLPFHLNEFYNANAGRIYVRLLPDEDVAKPSESGWMGGPSPEWLQTAWRALNADFRSRLASSIFLSGVEVQPTLTEVRVPIPQAWTADGRIDVLGGTLAIGDKRFASVLASLQPLRQTTELGNQLGAPVHEAKQAQTTGRGPGRPPFPEEDMIALAVERLTTRSPNVGTEAHNLLLAFQKRYPGRVAPAESMIRAHVTRLYAAAGERASTLNSGK